MQKIKTVWLWVVSLWLCGSGLAGAQANSPSALNHVSFPLRLTSNPKGHGAPVINMILNRMFHATFALDTGALNTFIPESVAHKLGLTPHLVKDENGKIAMFDDRHPLWGVHIDVMALDPNGSKGQGQLEFGSDVVVFSDKEWADSSAPETDGILGITAISLFSLLIDPVANRVEMWWPRTLTDAERAQVQMQDAEEIPLRPDLLTSDDDRLQVSVRLNDKVDTQLLMDTGSDSTYIPAKLAEQLQLKPMALTHGATTLSASGTVFDARLQQIKLGKLICWKPIVSYTNDPKLTDGLLARGILGMDVLLHYRMLLDAQNKKLYLKPIPVALPGSTEQKAGPTSKP